MKKLYGLIGYPLGHSFSREYHNNRFERNGIDAEYRNYELSDIGELTELIKSQSSLMGLNVTIPYKELVIPYLDAIDDVAKRIGAVNVIKISRENGTVRMVGYNSDYTGFRTSIQNYLQPNHTHALVFGSGGASKAVSTALQDLGLEVQIVSRTPGIGEISYDAITPEIMSQYKVLVNTTPLGMYPNIETCIEIPYELITPQHLCYDVVYNPQTTMFMRNALQQGAVVFNGMQMLIGQADAAWDIWSKE